MRPSSTSPEQFAEVALAAALGLLPLLGCECVYKGGQLVHIDTVGQIDIAWHEVSFEVGQGLEGMVGRVGAVGQGERVGAVEAKRQGVGTHDGLAFRASGEVEQSGGGDPLAVGKNWQQTLLAVTEVDARRGGLDGEDFILCHVPVLVYQETCADGGGAVRLKGEGGVEAVSAGAMGGVVIGYFETYLKGEAAVGEVGHLGGQHHAVALPQETGQKGLHHQFFLC